MSGAVRGNPRVSFSSVKPEELGADSKTGPASNHCSESNMCNLLNSLSLQQQAPSCADCDAEFRPMLVPYVSYMFSMYHTFRTKSCSVQCSVQ